MQITITGPNIITRNTLATIVIIAIRHDSMHLTVELQTAGVLSPVQTGQVITGIPFNVQQM